VNIACDCPDRSYRATTEDQYRRFSSRAFMPARVHPWPDHRQTSRVGRLLEDDKGMENEMGGMAPGMGAAKKKASKKSKADEPMADPAAAPMGHM